MVLPEANSDYEKMEMRGEKVDVNRIRQNVKEGMDNMKEKMKGWGEEVKESAQSFGAKAKEFSNTRGRAFASEVNETFRRNGGGLGHAIGVIFKVFFLFIAGTIAFALFVSLIALLFGGVAWWPINNFLWTSKWQQIFAWGTLIFFLVVPLIAFITWVIRRIVRAKSRNNYLGWTFGGLWTIGWVTMVLFVASITKDFRSYKSADIIIDAKQPVNSKLIVAVSQPELEYTGNFGWMNDGGYGWDISSDTLKLSAVKFKVKASADNLYHITLKKFSFGKTDADALNRAGKIQFSVSSTDSVLDVANGYTVDKESKFRGQHIVIEILVPVGKKIRFDESVDEKLSAINVKVKRSYRRNRVTGVEINNEENTFNYRSGVDYVMGIDGELKDQEGVSVSQPDNDYRYENKDSVRQKNQEIEIQKQIDEENRKREESEKRIRDLERKQKENQQKSNTLNKIKRTSAEDESYAGIPSPVVSLIEWF
jgi:hypothetical protein